MTETPPPAPRVSVVMTAYNGEAFVGAAIESILAQTLQDWELIVVDDASRDRTVDIIEGFSDPRIRLIRNDTNQGISNSRNTGIDAARGRYIAGHDQDDLSLPERLARAADILEANPDAVLAANWSRFQSNGHLFPAEPPAPPHVMAWRLFTRSNIYTSSVCLRARTLHDHNIRYRQTYHYAEDYELYHRLSEIGDLIHVPDALTIIGDHGGNTSIVRREEMDRNAKAFLLERYRDYVGEDVSPTDLDMVWSVAVFGLPAQRRQDLQRLGEILDRLTAAFLERRNLNPSEAQDVLHDASRFWWRIVKRTAQHRGPASLGLRTAFPRLHTDTPALHDRAQAVLRSCAGPAYYALFGK